MLKYILKRLLALIPVLLAVSVLVFLMVHMMPGDPAIALAGGEATEEELENIRASYGLDKSLPEQYFTYMNKILHGDLGTSYRTQRPVAQELLIRYPNTMKLACSAIVIAVVGGAGIGILSATKRYTIFDNASMLTALVGISIPEFYLGLMLMLIFCVRLDLLPISGGTGPINMILPAITLSFKPLAQIARMTRSSMLEVIRQDYIRTARAKGQTEAKIITKHALKNALIPVITVIGIQFASGMSGAVVNEQIFAIPGIGKMMVDAIKARNYPVVQGGVLIIALLFSILNLIIDLLYAFVDPRIKTQYARKKEKHKPQELAAGGEEVSA